MRKPVLMSILAASTALSAVACAQVYAGAAATYRF